MTRSYEIEVTPLAEVAELVERYHGYGSCGKASTYCFGVRERGRLVAGQRGGYTWLQRWEHWACTLDSVVDHVTLAGWRREVIPGRVWASGNQAHRIVQCTTPKK